MPRAAHPRQPSWRHHGLGASTVTAQAARRHFPCHAPCLSTGQPGAPWPQPRISRSSLSPHPRQAQSPPSLAPPAQPLPQPRAHRRGQDPRTGLRAPAHPKLSQRLPELPDCPRCLLPPPGCPRPGAAGKHPHGSAQLAREDPGPRVSLLTREQLFQVRSLPSLVSPQFLLQPSAGQGLRMSQGTQHYLPVPESGLDRTRRDCCPCPMELSPCPARCPVPPGASWAPGDNLVAICPPAERPNPDPSSEPVEQPAEQDPGAIPAVAGCFPTSPGAFDRSFRPCSQWPQRREKPFSVLSASEPRLQGPHCLFQPHHGWWRLGSDRSRPPGHGKLEEPGNLQVLRQLRGEGTWLRAERRRGEAPQAGNAALGVRGAHTHNRIPLRTLLTSARGEHDRPADIILVVHVAFD